MHPFLYYGLIIALHLTEINCGRKGINSNGNGGKKQCNCNLSDCKFVDRCPVNYTLKLDECGCCERCVPDVNIQDNYERLCLPGDCKKCKQFDGCPKNHRLVWDRCGCCQQCARIIAEGDRCDAKAQKSGLEVCQDNTQCYYDYCVCVNE